MADVMSIRKKEIYTKKRMAAGGILTHALQVNLWNFIKTYISTVRAMEDANTR